MLCPKCKIEMRNCEDSEGNWVAKCRNPRCSNYDCTVEVIVRNQASALDSGAEGAATVSEGKDN